VKREQTLEHLAECIALAAHAPPMTEHEEREHWCRCAEEDARAEARRKGTPQLPLH